MSTLNAVKFCFMMRANPKTIRQYIAIAYQTASDQNIFPKVVLVRSGIHGTTTIDGKHQKDPRGEHLTLCFKDQEMLANGTHVASHGYVASKTDSNIREATHTLQKADSTIVRRTGRAVWPDDRSYEYEIDVAFGHLPEESELN